MAPTLLIHVHTIQILSSGEESDTAYGLPLVSFAQLTSFAKLFYIILHPWPKVTL